MYIEVLEITKKMKTIILTYSEVNAEHQVRCTEDDQS